MDQKKVLIIEDEKSISDIIKFNLVKEGFAVETAYDGQDGLTKAIASAGFNPSRCNAACHGWVLRL